MVPIFGARQLLPLNGTFSPVTAFSQPGTGCIHVFFLLQEDVGWTLVVSTVIALWLSWDHGAVLRHG